MQEKLSILWNIIAYDEEKVYQDVRDILSERLHEDDKKQKDLNDLYDPYLLAGMKEAVERIKKAFETKERVMIFWDYDVDGMTSTAILMHLFKKIGMLASYRLPHRVHDGYGLKNYFIDEIKELWVSLIITVDCGTRDIEVIQYAKSLGIDVIVTDHHSVPNIIPEEAVAIINPKRNDCPYPFKELAGAWVSFKLMQALTYEFFSKKEAEIYIQESVDIAAIGTVADCMILTGENRIIVQEGLKQIRNTRSRGIRKMIEEKIYEDLDADIFSFFIGPKLNAAGRMDTPYKSVNLILNQNESVFETLEEIEKLNEKRKKLSRDFYVKALDIVNPDDNILFYSSPEIEHGIIGIIAGKLTERFYKPSIVLIEEGENLVASCRSPEYFDIVEILEQYKDYFEAFWGHKQAAGFTIKKERFADFKKQLLAEMNKKDFSAFKKVIAVDKILSPENIGFRLLEEIAGFKPFGIGNPKPVFMMENLSYDAIEYLWRGVEHIKIVHKQGYKICGFWFGEWRDTLQKAEKISIIFDIMEDNFWGRKNIMLKIIDVITE